MATPSDQRLLVLHALRLRGFGEADAAAEIVGIDAAVVEEHLPKLQADDLVLRRDGRLTGWALTPAGRQEQERMLAEELASAGARDEIEGAYRQFLELNPQFLEVCTDWQVKGEGLNDHADAAYDAKVIDRLGALHEQLLPILGRLEAVFERYRPFGPRFTGAVEKVRAGDTDWFTKPMIDSYHTVWFQLHEDLLNTLGIDRASEGST